MLGNHEVATISGALGATIRSTAFLELRQEAFQRAGLEAGLAVAVFEFANQQVIFG